VFERGTLWQAVTTTTRQALVSGILQPIPTHFRHMEDHGVRFGVRVLTHLARKRRALPDSTTGTPPAENPFLPHEPAMFVADISPTHICLLNRYNVVDHHILMVTRTFVAQETALGLEDFEALWACMVEYEALGFYNSGVMAGASQRHRHLQMVPLPLMPGGPPVPLEPSILAAETCVKGLHAPCLPFRHGLAQIPWSDGASPAELARASWQQYRQLLGALGLVHSNGETEPAPYNLLVARKWMLLVPRSRECFACISLNALAFAGTLLVHDEQQLEALKRHGPMHALLHVGFPARE